MRRAWILLPILVLAGCGGGGSSQSEQGGSVVQTVQISEKEFSLSPSTVDLAKTGTYEFEVKNDGQITHALKIEASGGGAEAETAHIAPGETKTVRFTFSGVGSYEMYCPIDGHEQSGLKGTVNIGGAAGAGGTTTTTGQTTTSSGYGY